MAKPPYPMGPFQTLVGYHFDRLCKKISYFTGWTTLYEAQYGGINSDIAAQMTSSSSRVYDVVTHDGKVFLLGNGVDGKIFIYDIELDTLSVESITAPQEININGHKCYQIDSMVYSIMSRPDIFNGADEYTQLNYINSYDIDPLSGVAFENIIDDTLPNGYRSGSLIKTEDDVLYYLFYDPSTLTTDSAILSDKIWTKTGGGPWVEVDTIPTSVMTALNNWITDHSLSYGSFTNAVYSKTTNSIYLILSKYTGALCSSLYDKYCVEYNLDTGIWTEITGIPDGNVLQNPDVYGTPHGPYAMSNGLIYYLIFTTACYYDDDLIWTNPYMVRFNPEDKSFTKLNGYPDMMYQNRQSLALNCPFVFECDANRPLPAPEPIFSLHYYDY